jgi:TatD DNase family protein
MLIDSHCHLDFDVFDIDRSAILEQCKQHNIARIIVPGVTAERWDKLLSLASTFSAIEYALGLHPMCMADHQPADINTLREYLEHHQPVAIGEIGLDFYLPHHDKESQVRLFEQQLELAVAFDLPVILHVRKAYDAVLQLLKKHRVKGGIVHAFSGSEQQAQLYIKLGFLLGIGGTITYDKATRVRELFSHLPLSAIALETDAPDMPLQEQISRRNSPESLVTILTSLAALRPEDRETIAKITTDNVNHLFGLSQSVG